MFLLTFACCRWFCLSLPSFCESNDQDVMLWVWCPELASIPSFTQTDNTVSGLRNTLVDQSCVCFSDLIALSASQYVRSLMLHAFEHLSGTFRKYNYVNDQRSPVKRSRLKELYIPHLRSWSILYTFVFRI